MAIPFLLYPIAEHTVSTSVTGMLNGGLPVVNTVVTALFTSTFPSLGRVLAVTIGAVGIAMISFASVSGDAGADIRGVLLLLVALLSYAVASNISRPLQAQYGTMPKMLWVAVFGTAWSMPPGLAGIPTATSRGLPSVRWWRLAPWVRVWRSHLRRVVATSRSGARDDRHILHTGRRPGTRGDVPRRRLTRRCGSRDARRDRQGGVDEPPRTTQISTCDPTSNTRSAGRLKNRLALSAPRFNSTNRCSNAGFIPGALPAMIDS